MSPESIREVLALVVAGHPCESVSFGATVTIVCGNEVSAARWKARTPDGVLPESRVPVQVVEMGGADEFAPHDDRGRLDRRSICGLCDDAYVECSKCGIYLCDCTRSETCEPDPVSRAQAIEAAEDHADQVIFDAWRERRL